MKNVMYRYCIITLAKSMQNVSVSNFRQLKAEEKKRNDLIMVFKMVNGMNNDSKYE